MSTNRAAAIEFLCADFFFESVVFAEGFASDAPAFLVLFGVVEARRRAPLAAFIPPPRCKKLPEARRSGSFRALPFRTIVDCDCAPAGLRGTAPLSFLALRCASFLCFHTEFSSCRKTVQKIVVSGCGLQPALYKKGNHDDFSDHPYLVPLLGLTFEFFQRGC